MKILRKDLATLTTETGDTLLDSIKKEVIVRITGLGSVTYLPKTHTGLPKTHTGASVVLLVSRTIVKACRLDPKNRVGLCQDYDVRDQNNALLADVSHLANALKLPVEVYAALPKDNVFRVITIEPSRVKA